MKKILIVTDNLARNGTETFIMNMYRNLNLKEFHVDFLLNSLDKDGFGNEVKDMGSVLFFVPSRARKPLQHYFGLNKFFKTHAHEYNAIHVCCSSLSQIDELVFAKLYKIPVIIVHAHSSSCLSKFTTFMHRFHQHFIKNVANRYLACSESAYHWFYNGIIPRQFSEVISNGIDVDKFEYNPNVRNQIREKFSIPSDTIVLGHVGRFSDVKNHKHIVNVLAEICKTRCNVRLMLVGDGENMQAIKQQACELNVNDKIIYVGQQNDVSPFLQAMDCFVMPSLYEGLPFVLVEAQAAGLPFVASTGISTESNILGVGEFVSLDSPHSNWAETILLKVETHKRINAKQSITAAGYSIMNTARRMEQIYSGY